MTSLRDSCPATASFLGSDEPWSAAAGDLDAAALLSALRKAADRGNIPFFIPDLCALELAVSRVSRTAAVAPADAVGCVVNPALELCELASSGCAALLDRREAAAAPAPGRERLLVWKRDGRVMVETAAPEDLAALKIVSEGIDPDAAAREAKARPELVRAVLGRALERGLVLAPPSRIRRDIPVSGAAQAAEVFTLQWHLTQSCDLSCRHCYDRSARPETPLARAVEVIDDFRAFCRQRNVRGQISRSGGNPLLYPHFLDVYRRAADEGFDLAILGNPAPPERIAEIMAIARPVYFQVSLEGLPEHNDAIRGPGHFERVMAFLDVLRDFGVQGQVMLTLTRDNMGQVLPLAELLEGRVWGLSFNRLSPVERDTALALPDPAGFPIFLDDYCRAADRLSVLSFKDNMLNAQLARTGRPTFGGCTGFGCGAAFNFMALLPDGEVHACRKFPSRIGDISRSGLGDIYDGPEAARYRRRSEACRDCSIAAVCGGCLAVTSGLGLDIGRDRDPFCPGPIPAGP